MSNEWLAAAMVLGILVFLAFMAGYEMGWNNYRKMVKGAVDWEKVKL